MIKRSGRRKDPGWLIIQGDSKMSTDSREGILQLDRIKIQRELEQMRYDWPQAEQSLSLTGSGRTSTAVWTAAIGAVREAGYLLLQLLREGAPSGESNFNRQIL
jgi:hypothetical protein